MVTPHSPATPGAVFANAPVRWVKGAEFIEVECASSTSSTGPVFVIASNRPWAGLPLDFKEQVSIADEDARLRLYRGVKAWAEVNGFLPRGDA